MPQVPDRRVVLDATPGPLHPAASAALSDALEAGWADPGRLYHEGRRAAIVLEQARSTVAEALGIRPAELAFLPAGWALPAALEGLAHGRRRAGTTVTAGAVEQRVVLEFAATRPDPSPPVAVDHDGRIDVEAWTRTVTSPGVAFASLQQANGEVGTLQPGAAAYRVCREAGIPLLVDATATLGRIAPPNDFDVLVGEATSWGGPPLGLLAVREGTRFGYAGPRRDAEHGLAAASPWVPSVVGAAAAWSATAATHEADQAQASDLIERIRQSAAAIPDVQVVGDPTGRLPHVVTFSALYLDGETLVRTFDRHGFAVASGSACTASTLEPSHVLAAMGALTHGNVRITLPLPSTAPTLAADVARFCALLPAVIGDLRRGAGVADL